MLKDRVKFLGLCILVSSLIISISLVINGLSDRYYYTTDNSYLIVFDKLTGKAFVTGDNKEGKKGTWIKDLTKVTE